MKNELFPYLSLHFIPTSQFKNQTANDKPTYPQNNPTLLKLCSPKQCLVVNKLGELTHIALLSHPFLPFSPPLAPFRSTQTLIIIISICPQNNTTVPRVSHPCPSTHGVGVAGAAPLRGGVAPILITLAEHTCENRCPLGLACCSSLGRSVCAWLFATPPLPSPMSPPSSSGSQRAGLA